MQSLKVRIMHYGDSQIEGDRISGRLRERLQKEFGGYLDYLLLYQPPEKSALIINRQKLD